MDIQNINRNPRRSYTKFNNSTNCFKIVNSRFSAAAEKFAGGGLGSKIIGDWRLEPKFGSASYSGANSWSI
jgi:hypothetical protein